ncbi:hypothetical protein V6N13_097302 [Hibiscus sabdariffa]
MILSAGSPTETLLRLLLPLNDKVQWTSRDVAGSEPPTSPRSRTLHRTIQSVGATGRLPGPVGQGYRLVEYISVARVRPRTSKGITDLVIASNFLGLSGHSPSKKLATEDHLRACFEHSNFFKVTAPEERPRPIKARERIAGSRDEQTGAHRLGNLRGLLPSLDVVAVSQAPSPESNPNSPINQVAFLRDVRPAWSSTHYLGRGEAITRREHRSLSRDKMHKLRAEQGPRPYAHEIFRIRKHDRASMHRRSRIMSIDTLGTPGTTEVHQAATRSLDGQGMAIHPKFHRFRYATQDPYRTPWARRPQGEDIEE